jgi:hypothetical protein
MTTFIARLRHAPYPYEGRFADTRRPFFDTIKDGQRAHTTVRDSVFTERRHYSDDRVLFHVPPRFDASRPFCIVVFFHGHNAELRRTVLGELQIARQIDLSGRNLVLIAPQLARDAADSAPGKLFRRNGFRRLIDEASAVLARRLGKNAAGGLQKAPIILAAYSGGYRATAYCLARGGMARRIKGIVLLDALYGEADKLAAWIGQRRGFTVVLGGPSTAANQKTLARRLEQQDLPVRTRLPQTLTRGDVVFQMTPTSHRRLPLAGPPKWPLAAILRAEN